MSPPLHGSLRKGPPAGQPCRSQDVGKLIEGGSAAPESVGGHTSRPRQAAGRPAAPKAWGAIGLRTPPPSANIAPVVHDLIIVGAGPAGISTAVEAREAGIGRERILVLEKGPAHSYAIRKLYPEDKRVDAVYKGIPAISEGRITIQDGTTQQTLDFLDETIQRWELNVRYDEGVDPSASTADVNSST